MSIDPRAGKPAPAALLIDVAALTNAYYSKTPDARVAAQRVQFGTSGHRGSSLSASFNEAHILCITQAICEHRRARGIDGPLFVGRDTHALSTPAQRTVLEVLAANGVDAHVDHEDAPVPTPVVSRAIVRHNAGRTSGLADGIVITPSHNPPEDGGIKYNPPHGGPAEGAVTSSVERGANLLLEAGAATVRRAAVRGTPFDFMTPYVDELTLLIDLDAIRASKLRIGVDPLGGASVRYWHRIAERHGLDLTLVESRVDPQFSFVRVDHDGKIRMDCSSPYVMAGVVEQKDRFDLLLAADPDADRHGVVTPAAGLLPPNHYLCVAVEHVLAHRPSWSATGAIGRTVVTTALIDRVASRHGRPLVEVPVGFKWFVPGLSNGSLCFGGEESAGASLLTRDGGTWTTDKDGIALGLLAAEIRARDEIDLGARYHRIEEELGAVSFRRVDRPTSADEKKRLLAIDPAQITEQRLGGELILARATTAAGNGEPIGGIRLSTASAWFAMRPSGTEALCKVYAESFRGPAHLERVLEEGQAIVTQALATRDSQAATP